MVETVSVSSESRLISHGASLWHMPTTGRGTSRGEMPTADLFFDVNIDFSGEEEIYPGAQRCSLRPRFSPRQVSTDAYTGAADDNIRDTHFHQGLKGHPSA